MSLLYDYSADLVRRVYDRRIDGPPVLDAAAHFPDAARFGTAWEAIRDEATALAERLSTIPRFHEIMPEQAAISANDGRDWRLFILKAHGVENPRAMAACPILAWSETSEARWPISAGMRCPTGR